MALTDIAESWLINDKLETLGKTNFDDRWAKAPAPISSPAHPVQVGDQFLTILTEPNPKAFLFSGNNHTIHFVAYGKDLKRKAFATYETPDLPYFHSVAATSEHIITHWNPFRFQTAKLLITPWLIDGSMLWSDKDSFILLANTRTGTVKKFPVERAVNYHVINAFETPTETVVDYVLYVNESGRDLYKYYSLDEIARGSPFPLYESIIRRYLLSKKDSTVTVRDFKAIRGIEFPRINDNFQGKGDYCFFYALTMFLKSTVVKVDLCKDTVSEWVPPTKSPFLAEPIFIANPQGTSEDDGVVITTYFDGVTKKTHQVVIDAKTMTLIATSELPFHLGFPLHGSFIRASY
jgi:carotenoid cleavage dioxygenase-like enzyme